MRRFRPSHRISREYQSWLANSNPLCWPPPTWNFYTNSGSPFPKCANGIFFRLSLGVFYATRYYTIRRCIVKRCSVLSACWTVAPHCWLYQWFSWCGFLLHTFPTAPPFIEFRWWEITTMYRILCHKGCSIPYTVSTWTRCDIWFHGEEVDPSGDYAGRTENNTMKYEFAIGK